MTTRGTLLVFLLFALAAIALCADVSGKWQWEMMASGGKTQYTLVLKQEAENLTGTLTSGEDAMPIQEGKISGDKLSFVVARTWGKRESRMTYQGRVFGDEIRFRVFMNGAERSWDMSARRVP